MKAEIEIVADAQQLAQAAARVFVAVAQYAVGENGVFSVALAGGLTPKTLYALLASREEPYRGQLRWNRMHFFWGDERHVPPEHSESNYHMAYHSMLAKVPVPLENVHRLKSEYEDAQKTADEYEQVLCEFFSLADRELPRFDLILLGMGPDGHVASIFPGSDVINENQRRVAAPFINQLNSYRITLTLPVFNNAACLLFLVSGANKAEALRDIFQGEPDISRDASALPTGAEAPREIPKDDHSPAPLPAQLIKPTDGRLLWLVDLPAARMLHKRPGGT